MMRAGLLVLAGMVVGASGAWGQFDLEESHSTASLRGVDAVGPGVAWASGSNGTILRTEDGGFLWQVCAIPKGGEKLDFRGVQAFDAQTSVVMSSGTGPLSKVYRTTDGCQTWTLVFENPDEKGFFDALHKVTGRQMYLMGDQVDGKFAMFYSPDKGASWYIADDPGREGPKGAGAFAASNSSFASNGNQLLFGTGATATDDPQVYRTRAKCPPDADKQKEVACSIEWVPAPVAIGARAESAGVFSLAARTSEGMGKASSKLVVVAVGGDYAKPDDATHTAAYSLDGGVHWQPAATMPGGYRSAVEYAKLAGRWIAVGPGGTDFSKDDGKDWTALKPGAGEATDVDKGWNAISLPFVVGARGKIGKLRDGVLK